MIAPTSIESRVRELIDELDGWKVGQPITIPFTAPIDLHSLLAGHRDPDFKSDNDVIYLINITPTSPNYGKLTHIDFGMGNFPVVLERIDAYWEHDPRGWTNSLLFDEENEDKGDTINNFLKIFLRQHQSYHLGLSPQHSLSLNPQLYILRK